MKNYYFCFKKGSIVNQIICAILINIPAFAYGMSIGWMSPMSLLLQSENSPRGTPLTDSEISWMAAAAYLTCIPSDFLMAYLSDKMGRKATLLFMSTVTVICWILKLSSLETWAFVTARALLGITMAGAYVTCPIYTKEISDVSTRGVLGSLENQASIHYGGLWIGGSPISKQFLGDPGERHMCKKLRRLNRVQFTKMSVCGLYTLDAEFPLKLLSLIATYAVVLLQFALLNGI